MENRLWQHRVYPFGVVDQLCDMEIDCQRAEDIRIVATHSFLGHEEIDHFTGGDSGCLIQVRVQAHSDEMSRRLRARPPDLLPLAHENLDSATQHLPGVGYDYLVPQLAQ